jgi:hypothetical protein
MSETTQLPAGRELDELIAEKVMGGVPRHPEWYWLRSGVAPETPDLPTPKGQSAIYCGPAFSTDIAAAWEVVEWMRARWAKLPNAERGEPDTWQFHDFADEGWRASVVWLHHDAPIVEVDEIAPTLPLAICRAALAAVEEAE